MRTKNQSALQKKREENQTHMFSFFSQWEKKEYFIQLFDKVFTPQDVVLIACSGGFDSMFLTYLLLRYRHIVKGQYLSITKILHFHHATSKTDSEASDFLQETFGPYMVCEEKKLPKNTYSETVLRNMRRHPFLSCVEKYLPKKSVILCLGHNLTDRIETSFLHFERGTHTKGIVNMQKEEKKYLFSSFPPRQYTIFRPLLDFPKETIRSWCLQAGIARKEDKHNTDQHQKRIHIRNTIHHLPSPKKEQLFSERAYVYQYVDVPQYIHREEKTVWFPPFWPIGGLYKIATPKTREELHTILLHIGVGGEYTSSRLHHIMEKITTGRGSVYLTPRWFLLFGKELFLAYQPNKQIFWDNPFGIHTSPPALPLDAGPTSYTIGGYTREIEYKDYFDAILTFPQTGDRFGSTSFTKRAAKQHIPFFRRRSLPIIKKNNTIIAVLPSSYWPWKQSLAY